MRHAGGCDGELAGTKGQFPPFEKEYPVTLQDLVDLVHPGMRMERVRLSCLERIQTNQYLR